VKEDETEISGGTGIYKSIEEFSTKDAIALRTIALYAWEEL